MTDSSDQLTYYMYHSAFRGFSLGSSQQLQQFASAGGGGGGGGGPQQSAVYFSGLRLVDLVLS